MPRHRDVSYLPVMTEMSVTSQFLTKLKCFKFLARIHLECSHNRKKLDNIPAHHCSVTWKWGLGVTHYWHICDRETECHVCRVLLRGCRVSTLTSVLKQISNVTDRLIIMKGYWQYNLMSAMCWTHDTWHLWCDRALHISGVTHQPLPALLSVTRCSGFKSLLSAPVSCLPSLSPCYGPVLQSRGPPLTNRHQPRHWGLRRFKWPPPLSLSLI